LIERQHEIARKEEELQQKEQEREREQLERRRMAVEDKLSQMAKIFDNVRAISSHNKKRRKISH